MLKYIFLYDKIFYSTTNEQCAIALFKQKKLIFKGGCSIKSDKYFDDNDFAVILRWCVKSIKTKVIDLFIIIIFAVQIWDFGYVE